MQLQPARLRARLDYLYSGREECRLLYSCWLLAAPMTRRSAGAAACASATTRCTSLLLYQGQGRQAGRQMLILGETLGARRGAARPA